MTRIASRVAALADSATLAMTERARQLKAQGVDVVSFGAGEPDWDTPDHVKEAGIEAIRAGKTKYVASNGLPELREAIVAKLEKENGLSYKPSQVLVSTGAKHAIFNIVMTLCEEGDEVLSPSPYWVSYPDQAAACGARFVPVPTREADGFRVRPEAIERALTTKSRLLILNSPSNPTGAVCTREDLEAIARIVVERDLLVLSDEIYENLVFGSARHWSIAQMSRGAYERTIVVNGLSKSFAMTGWRMGYAAGPKEIIDAAGRLQAQSTSNATSISQYAALAALRGDRSFAQRMAREYETRRDFVCGRLGEMKGVTCVRPDGAFYVFPNMSQAYGRTFGGIQVTSSKTLAEALLDQAHVAVVPGDAFGSDAHIRLSFATSMESLKKGLDRIQAFLG